MGDKITLRCRASPKIVNLPNGRSFATKYERISRKRLPRNIRVIRARKTGPRRNNRRILHNLAAPGFQKIKQKRRQAGRRLGGDLAKMDPEMGSKAINSSFGKRLINKGIDNISNLFKFGASKIKNKNVQKALQSELADMVVEEAQNKVKNKYDSLFKKNRRNKQLSDRRCDKKHRGQRTDG